MIDELITQIANTMNVSETVVRANFDKLINPPQPYVPLQGVCKSTKCSECDAAIRKRIRRFYRKKVRKSKCSGKKWKNTQNSQEKMQLMCQ